MLKGVLNCLMNVIMLLTHVCFTLKICLHCKTYICDKRKNIQTTVYTTIQYEIIYIKTPLQDLQLKAFMKNNSYSTEMNTNIHLITFSILLFTNFQTNKQR
jgi:hypothetical protein